MPTLKELRLQKGWTQKELGMKFRKTKPPEMISRWENGISIPSSLSLMEISQIFNVKFEDILIDLSINKKEAK
ncbi:helix-turn-helix transcriptional regulator [Robertmurraya siralis]|uniref:helix-turn-helix transcriptional regulator n=1 Tax=Robertmurraya siralis TaxID=77777 RepID=UPI0010F958B4|nr:helix-turn-helix transcriptional regulator [Robertmurraya siralis]